MATLTGGPTTEFFSGRFATIFGFSGSARSTISTESFPAGDMIGLPSSSHSSFSSFPTIMSGAACATLSPTDAKTAAAHNDDHERLIGMMALSRLIQRQCNPISSAGQQPRLGKGGEATNVAEDHHDRFEALEPVRQGVHRCFGSIAPGVARGLMLRHDHGSNYMSGDFQEEIECLGIEASPSFVREPQGNGVAERFIRTSHGDVQVKGVVLG